MPDRDDDRPQPQIDWSLTSFEGARREQLRRWAELPLERMLLAIEEMEHLAGSGRKTASECEPH